MKTLLRILHWQDPLFFTKDKVYMDLLQQSAQVWKEITEYRYLFTYGYKNQLYSKRNLPPFYGTRKRRNAFGLSGGRQMGASGRMNMSEKMLEL